MLKETFKHLKKLWQYEWDHLPEQERGELDNCLADLKQAVKNKDNSAEEKLMSRAETIYEKITKRRKFPKIAENVDVLLVALVVAMGIRTYFFQPFKIPTNSMFPTLRGVVMTPLPLDQPLPSKGQRIFDAVFKGRNYLEFDLPVGAQLFNESSRGFFIFRNQSLIFEKDGQTLNKTFRTEATAQDFIWQLLQPEMERQIPTDGFYHFKAQVDTGDHLFVNKMIYNFRKPKRGDAFVFRTKGLPTDYNLRQLNQQMASQFYIKRCVAVGDDEVRVEPPYLMINGQKASEPEIRNVWEARETNPFYKGYSHGTEKGQTMTYLKNAQDTFHVPPDHFWAMGDNSYNSADSRLFGPVPLENIIGKAFIIYYPFNRKFWLIQ
ncbi:MAG: signal peptidase I [Verrucomicrobiae bacterium]|nr:signal peptidase I [Verrucomicrobiae bacterium]